MIKRTIFDIFFGGILIFLLIILMSFVSSSPCTFSSECSNSGAPIADTGTSYIKFECQNGLCVKSASIMTECTSDAVCVAKYGTNSVCDLSPINWGNCKENSKSISIISSSNNPDEYCGDNICQSNEDFTTCSQDCSSDGNSLVQTNSSNTLLTILIIIGVLIVICLIILIFKSKKRK